jgi:hypothetical protein
LKKNYSNLDIITDENEVLNYVNSKKDYNNKCIIIDVGLKRNVYNDDIL